MYDYVLVYKVEMHVLCLHTSALSPLLISWFRWSNMCTREHNYI